MGGFLIILEQIAEEEGPVIEEELAPVADAIEAGAEAIAQKVEAEGEAILDKIEEKFGEGEVDEVEEACAADNTGVSTLTSESTGATIEATPGKTTTVLGRYEPDMKSILEQVDAQKSADFGPKPGGFNILNVDAAPDMPAEEFWNTYNKPFLDQAIARGDNIALATEPTPSQLTNALGEPTMFGREISYLQESGYTYDPGTRMMVKP